MPIRRDSSSMVMEPLQIIVGEPSPEVFELSGVEEVDIQGYQYLADTASTSQSAEQLQNAVDRFLEADAEKRKAQKKDQNR